jgi:hypothetical protein
VFFGGDSIWLPIFNKEAEYELQHQVRGSFNGGGAGGVAQTGEDR